MSGRGSRVRIMLTGGGSGGHVTPLLGVADALRRSPAPVKLHYVGVRHGLEARIVPREEIPLSFVPATGMPTRARGVAMLRFAAVMSAGVLKAMALLLGFRPHAIVASGGYASAPTVFAAGAWRSLTLGLWRIPVYLHEQNAIPGRMNRLAGRSATRIGVSHPASIKGFARSGVELVGYPIREGLRNVDRAAARRELGLAEDDLYLVVTGGSQGARTINRGLVKALPRLAHRKNLHILHASGAMKSAHYKAHEETARRAEALEQKPDHYRLVDYIDDMPVHLAAADLMLIRAGAGSLVEVCSAGIPAIVIPKANLPGDSQVANARELAARGAIEVLYEEPTLEEGRFIETVSGELLAERIEALLDDPERRERLSRLARASVDRHAARRIAASVLALAGADTVEEDVAAEPAAKPPDRVPQTKPLPSGPTELRRHVEKLLKLRFEQAITHGALADGELAVLPELDYLRYRGAALLVHPSWQLRNEGVKLVGLTRNDARTTLLLHMLTSRRKAPLHLRLLGGDFEQVGFIRRNILSSLALLSLRGPELLEPVQAALADPYYEVRSAALRLVRRLVRDGLELDMPTIGAISGLTGDSTLEVRWEAIHTFGLVGEEEEVLELCHRYALDGRVRIREAVIRAAHALLDRRRSSPRPGSTEPLEKLLDRFALTSVAFHPHFPLKERYAMLKRRLAEEGNS